MQNGNTCLLRQSSSCSLALHESTSKALKLFSGVSRSLEADSDDDLFSSPPKASKAKTSKTSKAPPQKRKASIPKPLKEIALKPDSSAADVDSEAEVETFGHTAFEREDSSVQLASVSVATSPHAESAAENKRAAPAGPSTVAADLVEGVRDGLELISGKTGRDPTMQR